MTGKTHQAIGLTAGLATYFILIPVQYGPATFAWVAVVSSLAALLPDIDQPTGRLWSMLPFGRVAGELVNPFLQHRNLSHSLLGLGLVGWALRALLHQLPPYWGVDAHVVLIAALVAYASHLAADAVTVEGIPVLFPYQRMFGFPPWPFQGMRILTGKWFENLVVFPLVNIVLIALLWSQRALIATALFK